MQKEGIQMFKKVFLVTVLTMVMASASVLAADFVSHKPVRHGVEQKIGWQIDVYKDFGDEKKLICRERIGSKHFERQEDGSIVYHTEHFTIVEPANESDDIILKVEKAPAYKGKITGEYILTTGQKAYAVTTPENKSVIYVKMIMRELKEKPDPLVLY
jgi:hypothetical protein